MRLHQLRLQAIGPFPGSHTIDFEQLGASGLFLLEGPTGAGKSTIIDAIVFALYGHPAGDGTTERLHSHHAAPGVTPEVELVFSSGEGTFRIYRSPKHDRPKSRGAGTTTQNARAKLWRLPSPGVSGDGAFLGVASASPPMTQVDREAPGEQISGSVQETGHEMARILPLSREQFTQTVVLPQGRFADFLHAKPEDRRAVLQEIFGTGLYQDLQELLRERAGAAGRGLDDASQQVRTVTEDLIRCAVDAGDLDGESDDGGDSKRSGDHEGSPGAGEEAPDASEKLRSAAGALDRAALAQLTEEICASWSARRQSTHQAREKAMASEGEAARHLDEARALSDHLHRRAQLLAAQHTVQGREAHVHAWSERVDLARRAARVAPAIEARSTRLAQHERATEEWRRDRDHAIEHGVDVEADEEALLGRLTELNAFSGRLEDHTTTEAGLPDRRAALADLRREITALGQRRAELAAAIERRPTEREELRHALQALAGAPVKLERAVSARQDALAALEAAQASETTEIALQAAEAAAEESAVADRQAAERAAAVHRRRIEGMAGELAQQLVPGQACTVCGSPEHPAPAELTADHPGEEDIERAETAARQAREAHSAARATVAERRAALASLRQQSDGLSLTEARERLAEVGAALSSAERREAARVDAEMALSDHEQHSAALREELGATASALATLEERESAQAARLTTEEEICAAARQEYDTVAARLSDVRATARALHTFQRSSERHLTTASELRRAESELGAALSAAGFDDAQAAQEAALTDAEIAPLEQNIEAHRKERHRVEQGLAEPEIRAVAQAEQPDVAALVQAHEHARRLAQDAADAATLAAERCRQVHEAAERLNTAMRSYEERSREAGPLRRVAALATAGEGNLRGLTLATYVLLHRFEDVVAEANEQLRTISDGRYTLERIDEREGGQRARRTGLGLHVMDHRTDEARHPRTLSGGETFYVSLCLALGLATVVLKERGGVELSTLFIDEGFGSLDQDTLDSVMTVLHSLRENGRTVGVISHVTEMKSRIPDRVTIRRAANGSSTLRLSL